MDRGDILSGAAFKAVLHAALVFLAVLLAMAVFSIAAIDRLMTDQVRLRVEEMAQSVSGLADDETGAGGETGEGLVERVRAVTRSAAGRTLAYAVFDAGGTRIAGNTDIRPEHGDWVELPVTLELAPLFREGLGELRHQFRCVEDAPQPVEHPGLDPGL